MKLSGPLSHISCLASSEVLYIISLVEEHFEHNFISPCIHPGRLVSENPER